MNLSKIFGTGLLVLILGITMLYLVLDNILVPKQNDVSTLLERQKPSEFYFHEGMKEYSFNNQSDIKEFSNLVTDKTAERVKKTSAKILMEKEIAVFDWGYKGRTVVVSDKGRVQIYVPKPDIRNKSRVHWLWWKINVFVDRTNYIAYITDADKRVANKVLEIKRN